MAELLFVLYLLSVIGGIVIVLGEERSAVSSIPWILVVIFLPVVGLLLYIIFGYSLRCKQLIDVEVRRLLSDAPVETKSLPTTKVEEVEEVADRKLASLSALIERLTDTPLTTANELTHYDDSREWLVWFVVCRDAIAQAQHYIYIELYRIEEDPWLDALLDLLAERIQEGVALYWLYDDVGSRSLSRRYRKRMEQLGGQVAAFLPVRFRLLTSRVNYRNHRNLVVVDGAVGFTGGNVLLSELHHLPQGAQPLATTHLRMTGAVVRQLEYSFALDWYVATQQLLSPQQSSATVPTAEPIKMQIFPTHPTDDFPSLEMIFTHAFLQARQSLYIESPVLIPTSSIQQALISTALSGVQVRVILPRRGRSWLATKASHAFFTDLLRAGVEIYYYDGLREETYAVIDKERVVTGTPYLDFRSFEYNFDLTTIAYSSEVARQFVDSFEATLALCRRITLRRNRLWRRIVHGVMRLLTPLI